MGVLVVAARPGQIVEHQEGRGRVAVVAGGNLDDPERHAVLAFGGEAELAGESVGKMVDEGGALDRLAVGVDPGDARSEGAVGGEHDAGGIDDRRHHPGLAQPAPGLARHQQLGLAGNVADAAALEPPQDMEIAADQAGLAAHRGTGQGQRRHFRLPVAAHGVRDGAQGFEVGADGEVGRRAGAAEPAAPGGVGGDQRSVAVGEGERRGRRRMVERGAEQCGVETGLDGGGRGRFCGGGTAQRDQPAGADQAGEEGAGEQPVADRPEQQAGGSAAPPPRTGRK